MTTPNASNPSGYRRRRENIQSVTRLQPPVTTSISLGDLYYIIFRQKWRILLCLFLGVVGGAMFYVANPPSYQSVSKLFIRYVVVNGGAAPRGEETQTRAPDQRGETIMDSEREILTSLDLARQTAEVIGPERILGKIAGGADLALATKVINEGLTVEVPPRSSVIRVAFSHPDVTLVQPVLKEVINQYYKMHLSIHQAVGMVGDFMTQETDQLRIQLAQTEEDLRKARLKAGVVSPEESKKAYSDQVGRIQQSIYSAQADLAEHRAIYDELTKNAEKPRDPIPAKVITEYRSATSRLEFQRKREEDLLAQYTPENRQVVNIQALIAATERTREELRKQYPELAGSDSTQPKSAQTVDIGALGAQIVAGQSRIAELSKQLTEVKTEASKVDEALGSIEEIRRRKELQESNYRYYAASLEQSRINEALGAGKVSNISQIQAPSSPMIERQRTIKMVFGSVVGGLAVGLIWAFFIELYVDRTVRRPGDIERIVGIPLFLSIPRLAGRKIKQLTAPAPQLTEGDAVALSADPVKTTEDDHLAQLQTFHETLRDRLIGYFESQGMTHKPKLVAVTGLNRRAGVTTTAAGLASSLSETGEGNVLLVDMTAGQGSAQQFYRGEKVCNLEEILEHPGSRQSLDPAQVQDRLYVVAEEPGQDKLSRILPQRFSKLVPKLKASSFDYIIFDMPVMSQISITPRLAGFMDMVLMVVDSEKTDRDLLQRATAMLAESNTHVGAVFNNVKSYVPAAFHQEYIGNS